MKPGIQVRGRRTATAVTAVAVLLALGAASCGDEESSETASDPAPQARGGETAPRPGGAEGNGPGSVQNGGSGSGSGGQAGGSGGGEDSSSKGFTPKPHEDSGGGAKQFRIPGGDNSVQEFGKEGEGADFERAAAALHGFYDARAEKAWAAACSYLAGDLVTSLEQTAAQAEQGTGTSCAAALELSTNTAAIKQLHREAAEVDVGSLRLEGERGFLLYRYDKGTIYAIPVIREDGGWKVASLSGIPLT